MLATIPFSLTFFIKEFFTFSYKIEIKKKKEREKRHTHTRGHALSRTFDSRSFEPSREIEKSSSYWEFELSRVKLYGK